jgi:hypothetical protein
VDSPAQRAASASQLTQEVAQATSDTTLSYSNVSQLESSRFCGRAWEGAAMERPAPKVSAVGDELAGELLKRATKLDEYYFPASVKVEAATMLNERGKERRKGGTAAKGRKTSSEESRIKRRDSRFVFKPHWRVSEAHRGKRKRDNGGARDERRSRRPSRRSLLRLLNVSLELNRKIFGTVY